MIPIESVSVEMVIAAAGVILAVLFAYVPKLNDWYYKQGAIAKRGIMAVVCLVVLSAIYFGACYGLISGIACGKATIYDFVYKFVLIIIANQSAYSILPESQAKSKPA
jgi:ribose/xylose/arabinose/galactoside ABC-type transport system permease subunit